MSKVSNFVNSLNKKKDLIYDEINQFIINCFNERQKNKTQSATQSAGVRRHCFYLSDPDSSDLSVKKVTGISVENGVAYITLQPDPEDESDRDLWYEITFFMIEDVLNIIDDIFG